MSINASQARLGPNGAFRVAIAQADPKVPGLDYLTTASKRRGRFIIRWLVSRTAPPHPTSSR